MSTAEMEGVRSAGSVGSAGSVECARVRLCAGREGQGDLLVERIMADFLPGVLIGSLWMLHVGCWNEGIDG